MYQFIQMFYGGKILNLNEEIPTIELKMTKTVVKPCPTYALVKDKKIGKWKRDYYFSVSGRREFQFDDTESI